MMDINQFLYDILLENLNGEETLREKAAYFDIFHFDEPCCRQSIKDWVTEQLLVWIPDSDSHFFKAICNTVDYDWIYDEFFSEFLDTRRWLRYEEEEEKDKIDNESEESTRSLNDE
jgi:hypothetical protein